MKIYNNVSKSQLSIAVRYGGATISGEEYIYDPKNDVLYRKKDKKEYLASLK